MEIRELRIDDWIKVSDRVCQVEQIDNKIGRIGVRDKDGNRCGVLAVDAKCQPIPLTEDLLLKCGFKHDQFGDFGLCLDDDNFALWIVADKSLYGSWRACLIYKGNYITNNFGSLHQLQNLYFAITGRELGVKL